MSTFSTANKVASLEKDLEALKERVAFLEERGTIPVKSSSPTLDLEEWVHDWLHWLQDFARKITNGAQIFIFEDDDPAPMKLDSSHPALEHFLGHIAGLPASPNKHWRTFTDDDIEVARGLFDLLDGAVVSVQNAPPAKPGRIKTDRLLRLLNKIGAPEI